MEIGRLPGRSGFGQRVAISMRLVAERLAISLLVETAMIRYVIAIINDQDLPHPQGATVSAISAL